MIEQKIETAVLAPRRRVPLYALYAANVISRVGDVLTLLALPWFVLQTTGSVARTGITAFCSLTGVVISALVGGPLVDRLGHRRASVLSDLASALCVALVPLLYAMGALPFWGLLALVFAAGLLVTPGGTARVALVPDLAALARARLERVNAMTDGISRVAGFIGAPLAGVLIAVVGATNLLWIDAATFAASAALIGLLVPARLGLSAAQAGEAAPEDAEVEASQAAGAGSYLDGIRVGLRFIWRDRLQLSLIAVVLVTNLLDAGNGAVLAPAYIKQVFGSAVVLGEIIAAFGGAAFLGTMLFGAIGHRLPRRLTLGIGFTIAGAPRMWVLALFPSVPVLLVTYAIAGLCIAPVNPMFDTVAFERIPASMRARVFGVITAGAMLGAPLGALVAGFLAAWTNPRVSLLAFGVIYFAATASILLNPAMRALDKKPVG